MVGEGVMSNLVAKALESLAKAAFKEAATWWGARDELKKLENSMRLIKARVGDAERCQEDASSGTIKEWLYRLKLVLYRVDDLFDEVLTRDRQKRMERSMLGKVGILFDKSGPLYYNRRLANEIRFIRKELDAVKSDMAGLSLSNNNLPAQHLPMARIMEKRETASFVNMEDVLGRENDANLVIEMLFDSRYDGENLTVIPIVGFGGLGKTTLAQLVFNDERVQNHFDLTKWAYVPEKDDLKVIMGKIFSSFTDRSYDSLSLDVLKQGIKESIATNKYLLALDDLWDEGADRLFDLANLLKCGKQGSKVIVTTRSDVIAKVFGTIEAPHKLGTLSDDQSMRLFKRLAFKSGQEEKNPALCTIGEEIVKMCGNVPLAIKVVGGSLRSKDTEEEWLQLRDAQHSKAQLTKGGDIMDVLRISYDNLQPALKQCFVYCSLFPKGASFRKELLVSLWMAQGYFEQSDEDIGDQYYLELLARNFFQSPEFSDEGELERCYMHDLLYDLAQEVAGDESMVLGDKGPTQISDRLVHVTLITESPPSLLSAKRLRSMLCMGKYVDYNPKDEISKFQSLRVLFLSRSLNMQALNSIGKLIHLRFLMIGKNFSNHLPDSITRLENLQVLDLESCRELKLLPKDFGKLSNLRHLVIPDSLNDMPSGFGKLTSLQQLNGFIVGKNNGIDSLPALNLRGELRIAFRKWRGNAILEGKRSNLKDNKRLSYLFLNLDFEEEEDTLDVGEMNIMLTCLELPPKLKHLYIYKYLGDEMPRRWFDGLSKLVRICIDTCEKCKVLPQLSQLPHLKSLKVLSLNDLEYAEEEENIRDVYFPSLQVMELRKCSRLKGWTGTGASGNTAEQRSQLLVSPSLLQMEVDECCELMSMPLASRLESLVVRKINGEVFKSNLNLRSNCNVNDAAPASLSLSLSSSTLFTSLKKLEIDSVNDNFVSLSISSRLCNLKDLRIQGCDNLEALRFETPNSIQQLGIYCCRRLTVCEGLQNLSTLETLAIMGCAELDLEEEGNKNGWGWQALTSLGELRLSELPKMKKLPGDIGCLTALQFLSLAGMDNLTELPEEIGSLPRLCDLCFDKCPQLKSLPPSIRGLTTLQSLHIKYCPYLARQYCKPDGEDCHLIQQIPHFQISW